MCGDRPPYTQEKKTYARIKMSWAVGLQFKQHKSKIAYDNMHRS